MHTMNLELSNVHVQGHLNEVVLFGLDHIQAIYSRLWSVLLDIEMYNIVLPRPATLTLYNSNI